MPHCRPRSRSPGPRPSGRTGFPVRSADPTGLVARLHQAGVDASGGASKLMALSDDGPGADLMRHLVHVPAYPELPAEVAEAVRRVLAAD